MNCFCFVLSDREDLVELMVAIRANIFVEGHIRSFRLQSGRESFLDLVDLPLGGSLQRLHRSRVVDMDDAVELIGEANCNIMT